MKEIDRYTNLISGNKNIKKTLNKRKINKTIGTLNY
jgi:hypothetical protein